MQGSGRQAARKPGYKHPAWETNEKKRETNKRKWEKCKEVGDKPAGNPTTSTENGRKWETSQPPTRPQAPSLRDKK